MPRNNLNNRQYLRLIKHNKKTTYHYLQLAHEWTLIGGFWFIIYVDKLYKTEHG